MTIYIVFIVLSLIFACIFDRQEEKSKAEHLAFWSLCLYLICMSGFSFCLGGDKMSYINDFEELPLDISLLTYIQEQFEMKSYMPMWSIINYVCKDWFDSFYVVQFIESIVVNILICYIARKYTTHHFLFLALFFLSEIYFQFNTEVMREGFAIAIGLLSIHKYEEKHNIMAYFVGIAFALTFHLSAIVLFVYPLFTKININITKKSFAIFCIIIVCLWTISDVIVTYIFPHLPLGGEAIAKKITMYMGTGTTMFGFANLFCRYIVLPFIAGYCYMHYSANTQLCTITKHILLFELTLGALICIVGFGFSRLFNYVRVINLCWIVTLLVTIFQEKKYIITRTFAISLYALFAFLQWNSYLPENNAHFYDLFVPYTSCFNKDVNAWNREYIYLEAVTPMETNAQRNIKD